LCRLFVFKPDYASINIDEGTMNGLRMFVRPDTRGQVENNVFYSQRSHGPIYRWHYEEQLQRWHVARMDSVDWCAQELCSARWHSVPQGLKAQLSEHYVE